MKKKTKPEIAGRRCLGTENYHNKCAKEKERKNVTLRGNNSFVGAMWTHTMSQFLCPFSLPPPKHLVAHGRWVCGRQKGILDKDVARSQTKKNALHMCNATKDRNRQRRRSLWQFPERIVNLNYALNFRQQRRPQILSHLARLCCVSYVCTPSTRFNLCGDVLNREKPR